MGRTDRLLAIILELQRSPQRAEDLAATLEVSQRTIYRDIQVLSMAGVPIVAVTGQGYSLIPGYFLPPVSFTADEAFMLMLGSHVMTQHFDAQYRTAAQTAHRKIEAVLSEQRRAEVQYLKASISFLAGSGSAEVNPEQLRQLRRAILDQRRIALHYQKRFIVRGENADSPRKVDPYGLIHHGDTWYLVAFCHSRQAVRHFRLNRIRHLEVLEEQFDRPKEFLSEWRQHSEPRSVQIRVLFDPEAARWLPESRSFYITHEEAHPAGLLVTLQVRQEREVLGWLLSWGAHICVLEPKSLRDKFAQEAEKMLNNHRDQSTGY